jgi:hypothetical protein
MVGELEMWDSIPQLEQGSKRACGFEVCSPTVFSGSGLIPFTIRNLPLTFMDHSSEAEEISMTMAHLNHKLV